MEMEKTNNNSLKTEYLAQNLIIARDLSGRTLKECSSLLGIPTSRLKNYESGKYIPSLPELESISFLLRIPLSSFFIENGVNNLIYSPKNEQLIKLIDIRQQIIGTKILLYREDAKISVTDLSKNTSIPTSRIKRYEEGNSAIPIDELNLILNALDLEPGEFLDHESPIGEWQNTQSDIIALKNLPEDIRRFVTNSENLKFVKVAKEISMIGIQKIRNLANALLDIINSVDHLE